MNTREKCNQILDTMSDFQIELVFAYLQVMTALSEAEDDAFCEELYHNYLNSPDKNDFISEDELFKELGIAL